MNKLLKVIKILLTILIIIIVCLGIIINKDKIISKIPVQYLVIKSGSMQPTLNINDIVIIKKKSNYNIGDIITFSRNNQYFVTHRIQYIENNGFITKGDNNNCVDDDIVKAENIQGKVIFVITPHTIIISLGIISTLIIIYIIWKLKMKKVE